MKKFASLLLTVVLLATMLTVFALPASAETEPIECNTNYPNLNITSAKNYIIKQDCTLRKLNVSNKDSTLTIPEGVTVTVTEGAKISLGTVKLNGTLDVSGCRDFSGEKNINIGDTGNLIKPNSINNDQNINNVQNINPFVEDNVEKLAKSSVLSSVLSEGSLTIIVGIAAAVVFGLGGFFIGKAVGKKKKPALAEGENKDEE